MVPPVVENVDALQTSSIIPSMLRTRSVAIFCLSCASVFAQTVSDAHFHHLHLNATDPNADIEFYTTKFDAAKGRFAGLMDAVWVQKSWILFNKVPYASRADSGQHHLALRMGRGGHEGDLSETGRIRGRKFDTPITDISDIGNPNAPMGRFFYAYVLGPDDALIELNTANHHHFGHIHLLSDDPVAAKLRHQQRQIVSEKG